MRKMEEKTIYIKFLDKESEWTNFRYFNSNAYPENVRYLVNSCWRRFSLILEYYKNMCSKKRQDTNKLLKFINYEITKIKFPNKDIFYEISFESIGYLSNLYMILFMIKSFLDIWTKVCVTLIDPKAKIRGFHRAKIDNENITGGKFIHWLERNVPQTKNIESLTKLVYDNVRTWINDTVKYRDQILHHGEVKNIRPIRAVIKEKPKNEYLEKDLIQASMPDSTSVLEYCRDVIIKLNNFIIESIKLMPNVNYEYLSLDPLII